MGRCGKVIRNQLYGSNMVFRDLQWKEIVLYLRYHMTDSELTDYVLKGYCPRRRYGRRPPVFETSGSDPDKSKRHEPWIFPKNRPHEDIVRKMFCMAIEIMVIKTMSLHDFQFDDRVFRQKSGGAIGLDLTGVVSDI